ncbi:P450 monooxygenase [Lecanosticta acicola]|uniref:P450 monooxygenase n=1 Tax=Lecanosticta acicola TaxID=111012 RepID=A0AAI9EAP7_9PEZI|nr:P450 monooxygenase [Lecanosticta acicola]
MLLSIAGSIALLVPLAYLLMRSAFSVQGRFWRAQKWAGPHSRWILGGTRRRLVSLFNTRQLVHQGYQEHSSRHLPFALSQFNSEPILLLPASYVPELISKSDEEVSLPLVAEYNTAAYYTGDQHIVRNPLHVDLVKQHLTRKLPSLTQDVAAELSLGFEEQWQTDPGNWTSVRLYSSCMKIVSRGANRVFCGQDLCRNPEFLEHSRRYTEAVFGAAAVINLFPLWARTVVAPIATYAMRRELEACKRIALPVIAERLRSTHVADSQRDANSDALQWLIEDCIERGDSSELDPTFICRRLLRLNMAAIHTTSISITITLLDVYSSPDRNDIVESLREECHRVLAANGGKWTENAVSHLVRVDSAIKESMRLCSFGLVGTNRLVTGERGVTFKEGFHVPAGVRIGTPIDAIHRDSQFYTRPLEYDTFRFSDARGTTTCKEQGKPEAEKSQETLDSAARELLHQKNQGLVTTSNTFLVFGHGRHACPGRFFASQEMKLMLAHVVMNYEVEMSGPRPANSDLGIASVPSSRAEALVNLRTTPSPMRNGN